MEYESGLTTFGRFLRDRRKQLGLTQTQLGDRLGWAQERVSVLERGKYGMPSLPQLCRLADALEVSLQEILHHLGVTGKQISSPRSSELPDGGAPPLNQRLVELTHQMRVVEERLHDAEHRMVTVEALRASIREQRERMGALLLSCRGPQSGAPDDEEPLSTN